MTIQYAACAPEAHERGSFALVTYLPDPLRAFLADLRHTLPGDNHADAHVTFLPPRALALPLDIAFAEINEKLSSVMPFELELGCVHLFPETNILYLSVAAGHDVLLTLHSALNHGALFANEPFEFVPHLTLGGPLLPHEVHTVHDKASALWRSTCLSKRFLVDEAVLLWQPDNSSEKSWTRLSSFTLVNGATAELPPPITQT